MEQKRPDYPMFLPLREGERGKLGVGMLLAVLCSALSLIPYLVVYQILLLIIRNEVTFGTMAMWACIGIAAAIGQTILHVLLRGSAPMWRRSIPCTKSK